jgi:hypothetical protein
MSLLCDRYSDCPITSPYQRVSGASFHKLEFPFNVSRSSHTFLIRMSLLMLPYFIKYYLCIFRVLVFQVILWYRTWNWYQSFINTPALFGVSLFLVRIEAKSDSFGMDILYLFWWELEECVEVKRIRAFPFLFVRSRMKATNCSILEVKEFFSNFGLWLVFGLE